LPGRSEHLRTIIRLRQAERNDGRKWLLECGHEVPAYDGASAGRTRRIECGVCAAEDAAYPVHPVVNGHRRVCQFPGCDTVLNRYNKGRMCSMHRGF